MVPSNSAMMAWSFGRRASKSSATRGRPPVMSRVFEDSRGRRARTSPAFTVPPFSTFSTEAEGAHRELCARLADRLGGDDAHRLADIHRRAAREVTAIAVAADAGARVAGEDGADIDL